MRPRTPYMPVFSFGPDLYETTRSPRRKNKKDRKDRKDRRKNNRRRKNKKKAKAAAAATPAPPVSSTTAVPFNAFFSSSPSSSFSFDFTTPTYNTFTTIWNLDDRLGGNTFPADYDDDLTDNMEGDVGSSLPGSAGKGEGWISLWTIYIIVGAIAGVILLIGLLAILIAVCCRREEESSYKSTPV